MAGIVSHQPGQNAAPPVLNMQPMGVVAQPTTGVNWMERPVGMNCPPGLEYLASLDQVVVEQQLDVVEVFTGHDTRNRYIISNKQGQQIYYAIEESGCCARTWCGEMRGFTMHITDLKNQEVLRLVREFKCCASPCFCCVGCCPAMSIIVQDPHGNVMGEITQARSGCAPRYVVSTPDSGARAEIHGPACVCSVSCCGDVEFPIVSSDQGQVGSVTKHHRGLVMEVFTNVDKFTVSFPINADVKMKATYLAAMFLIDFMFFQRKK